MNIYYTLEVFFFVVVVLILNICDSAIFYIINKIYLCIVGISFYVFEKLKFLSLKYFPNVCGQKHSGSSGGVVLSIPAKLLCGGFAGAMAQTIS